MKHLIQYILIALFNITSVIAQNDIYGTIMSSKGEELPYTNIILYDASSQQLVKGVISNENGSYILENIIKGTYYIEVSTLGFNNKKTPVFQIGIENLKKDFILGVESLDEVVVISRQPIIKQTPEKLTIDFQKAELVNTNLRDVMKKIPGVIITNNNISYAGQGNIRILINGKNTDYLDVNSLLREIPANNISKVELVNQPGAEYEAEGSGPLINVILKKTAKLGTNGTIGSSFGYTNDFNYGTNASFSTYKNNLSIQATVGFSKSTWREDLTISRTVLDEIYQQTSVAPEEPISYTSSISVDYDINSANKIGISTRGLITNSDRTTKNLTTITAQSTRHILNSDNIYSRNRVNFTFNPYYEFKNDSETIFVDFNYVNYADTSEIDLIKIGESAIDYQNRRYDQEVDFDIFTYKADYDKTICDKLSFKFGSKYTNVNSRSTLKSLLENEENEFIINNEQSNLFIINENIFALYGKMNLKLGKWNSAIGLRWENSSTKGSSMSDNITNKREISKLFPSVSFSRILNKKLGINLAYSRRIERPAYSSLNTFVQFYDAFTFQEGNPMLQPSFTNKYALAFTYKEMPLFSINYGRTLDALFQILTQNNETAEIARTTINLAEQTSWDFKISAPLKLIRNVDGYIGTIINNNSYVSKKLEPAYDKNKWGATLFINAYYELPYKINSEVSTSYTTGGLEGQVEYKSLVALDIALSKNFLRNRLKATIQFADIINPPFRGNLNYDSINANIKNNGVGQNFFLKLEYNLGTKSDKNITRKNISEEEENRIDNNN